MCLLIYATRYQLSHIIVILVNVVMQCEELCLCWQKQWVKDIKN